MLEMWSKFMIWCVGLMISFEMMIEVFGKMTLLCFKEIVSHVLLFAVR